MASEDLTVGVLSGSTAGRPIVVVATATAGTLIHTPASTAPNLELVTLYACNIGASTRTLTMEWGTATSPPTVSLEVGGGWVLVADRLPIQSASNVIRAFASAASEVLITGRVTYYEAPT